MSRMNNTLKYQEELMSALEIAIKNVSDADQYEYDFSTNINNGAYVDEFGNLIITANDLGSVLSVLDLIVAYAKNRENEELIELATTLQKQWHAVFEITDTDKLKLPYNRKDYSTILEYLKLQAEQLSNGKWNDFTDSDIGVVLLKLMSYLADMENYNVDKSIAELYLSTCKERSSALLLCKLIGYEPRHYMSAVTDVWLDSIEEYRPDGTFEKKQIEDGTIFPAGSTFTSGSNYIYTTLEDATFADNLCRVTAYEGTLTQYTFTLEDIDKYGRIKLPEYNIAFNTAKLFINSEEYKRVENVAITTGELAFSIHCSEDRYIYIQLPAFWSDVVTAASTMKVTYLLSNGYDGRIGKDKLIEFTSTCDERSKIAIKTNSQSIEGYNPETIEEIKHNAPIFARTMNTIVTIKDFEEIGSLVDGIADIRALDYNDPSSGLVQPTPGPGGYVNDAYKVNIYALPETVPYDEDVPVNNRYRNTMIKYRDDWEWDDMQYVAEDAIYFAQTSIAGNTITLEGYGDIYTDVDDVVLGVKTGKTVTSFLPTYVEPEGDIDWPDRDIFTYKINITGSDIIITMCTDWRDYMPTDTSTLVIFFKQTQVLTKAGQQLRDTIDEKRLHSLWITYYDVDIIQPTINVEVYMDSRNVEFESVATNVKDFIVNTYARDAKLKIGDPIFASVIGADILDEFDYIRYVEVGLPTFTDDKVEALPKEFIDIIPPNVTVQAFDYQNKTRDEN